MKKIIFLFVVLLASCQRSEDVNEDNISIYTEKLKSLGFDLSQGFYRQDDGFVIENDIFMTRAEIESFDDSIKPIDINHKPNGIPKGKGSLNMAGNRSQYRTNQLVSNSNHLVKIYLPNGLENIISSALLNTAIQKYNNVDLQLKFVTTNQIGDADIVFESKIFERPTTLMSAGFPQNSGKPYPKIYVNPNYNFNNRADGATVIAHELGHCIGFRHTDYMNRVFSCGIVQGTNSNEGEGDNGAVHIPHTPLSPDNHSWMLACSSGQDRPFTIADTLALKYLYGKRDYRKLQLAYDYVINESQVFGNEEIEDKTTNVTITFLDQQTNQLRPTTEFMILKVTMFVRQYGTGSLNLSSQQQTYLVNVLPRSSSFTLQFPSRYITNSGYYQPGTYMEEFVKVELAN